MPKPTDYKHHLALKLIEEAREEIEAGEFELAIISLAGARRFLEIEQKRVSDG